MDNFLDNGAVLPSGLLSGTSDLLSGFNKTYKNTSLRMGIVVRGYEISNPKNLSKLSIEYDVQTFEQNEDIGSTIITYKNCLGIDGLGSIADYFEKNFRIKEKSNNLNTVINTTGQDGSVVLLLCIDGVSEKAIIIGGLTHPNRPTNLTSTAPQLYGEYNGVQVQVNPDGSTSLTFKGATDNNGNVINPNGTTVFQIQSDGSYEFTNSSVAIQGSKNGQLSINCTGAANIVAQGDVTVSSQGAANIKAQGDVTVSSQGAANVKANGKVSLAGNGESATLQALGYPNAISDFTGLPIESPSTSVYISE
jgi:hypothetical protein